MAKIIKVASSTSTSNTNQINTSRVSTTNPFKYQNFEGHTLPFELCADVFETAATRETSKLKMIASSVAGSMHRIKSSITEPIINFVNRVYEKVGSAWDYAKSTNISDLPALKGISESIHNFGERINSIEIPGGQVLDSAKNSVKAGYETVSGSVIDFGTGIKASWMNFVSKLHGHSKISAETPVVQLESMLKTELDALYREVA